MAFGARLTTRPTVGKVMVAITCDLVSSGWYYGDAVTMLREGLFKLHYINPTQLGLKLQGKKMKQQIYGFNKHSVYTVKNLNTPDGDSFYRNYIKVPKVCKLKNVYSIQAQIAIDQQKLLLI